MIRKLDFIEIALWEELLTLNCKKNWFKEETALNNNIREGSHFNYQMMIITEEMDRKWDVV
jgi:hypothetical protein